mgnify:FL=1
MPFIQWDVTSLTTHRQGDDEAYGFYFGTKNGVAGYWVRIPDNAPPIGDITLAGVVGSDPVGLSFVVWYTSIPGQRDTARTITSFEKGGRWINLGTTSPGVAMAAGVHKKSIRLFYRSVNEGVALSS